MFRDASPSVAYITTESVRSSSFAGTEYARGAGSGFVWDQAGHVVTNYRVIQGMERVYVQLDADKPIAARVLGGAPDYDIAVAADERVAAQLGARGVVVLGVIPGSPADRAGIRPFKRGSAEHGDVIFALDGKPVETLVDLVTALEDAGIGSEVVLKVRRRDTERDVRVRVTDLKD